MADGRSFFRNYYGYDTSYAKQEHVALIQIKFMLLRMVRISVYNLTNASMY